MSAKHNGAAAVLVDDDGSLELGEVLEFMRLLWAVDHGLQSTSKRLESAFGVTGPQRLAIRMIGRFPGISAGRLAIVLHVHPSTLTGVLARLESRGLVTRKSDPNDARRAVLHLTAKGSKLDLVRTGTVEAVVRRVIAKLPKGDLDAAERVLSTLAQGLAPKV